MKTSSLVLAPLVGLGLAMLPALNACSGTDAVGLPGEWPEGALISTRMESRVGVLLDELPAELRDRAAEQALGESDAFWEQRARAQIGLSSYRLVFRNFYYDEEEGRGQLPLPPVELWQIELDDEAERTTVAGHDLVVRGYTLTSTLLTDEGSAGASDPALSEIGGTWEEPFVFPLDPELLLQRTGYACMDEAEFPPNSVDGENVATFYDHECEAGENECHLTEVPDEDCVAALERAVGSIETAIRFERLAWDDELADEARIGDLTDTDEPDVRVMAEGLDVQRVIYRYIDEDSCALAEGCVGGTGWRRLLQFDASVHNVGGAALDIGDVDYYLEGSGTPLADHNIFEYSDCHEHYHFSYYGDFLFESSGEQSGNKQAFCLQSTNRYSNNEYSPLVHPYGSCEFQGVQAGWGDDYGAGIECQWIDVTAVDVSAEDAEGELTFVFNPQAFLCEGTPVLDDAGNPTWEETEFETVHGEPVDRAVCDFIPDYDDNNREEKTLDVTRGGLITSDCARGQLGPLRDCGFSEGAGSLKAVSCPPGESVTVRCSLPDDAAPAVLRACEYSDVLAMGTSCVLREALTNESLVSGDNDIDVECPAARSETEPGGTVALYAAPLLPGDALEIECSVLADEEEDEDDDDQGEDEQD
jgi:hypothetical protein